MKTLFPMRRAAKSFSAMSCSSFRMEIPSSRADSCLLTRSGRGEVSCGCVFMRVSSGKDAQSVSPRKLIYQRISRRDSRGLLLIAKIHQFKRRVALNEMAAKFIEAVGRDNPLRLTIRKVRGGQHSCERC